MYPFIRLAWVMANARRKPPLGPDDHSDLRLTAWPWDCDVFVELNNGRQLTLFDLGRFEFGQRVGLLKALRDNRWGLTVAGSTMQYRRRIRPFERLTLRTRIAARDEKWFYMLQTAYVGDQPASQGLLRTAVIGAANGKKRGVIPTQIVAEALGHPEWRCDAPEWVRLWIDAEHARPWPPEPFG
ncbi:MAG: thioesterase family protein [Neomegalonema sp.]|nr:thioesterase family protein [Neomegalonema sp.]